MSPTPTSASGGTDPRWSNGSFSNNNDQTTSSFIVSTPSKSADDFSGIEMLMCPRIVSPPSIRKMHQSNPQRTRAGHANTCQSINLINALWSRLQILKAMIVILELILSNIKRAKYTSAMSTMAHFMTQVGVPTCCDLSFCIRTLNILFAHSTFWDFLFPIFVEIDIALNRGDKILAINGKKISEHLCTVDEVFDILYSKTKMTLFVLRPRKNDKGYKWVHERE